MLSQPSNAHSSNISYVARNLNGLKATATPKCISIYFGNTVWNNRRFTPMQQYSTILRQQTIASRHEVLIILSHFDGLQRNTTMKYSTPYAGHAAWYLDGLKATATPKCVIPNFDYPIRNPDRLQIATTFKRTISNTRHTIWNFDEL